MRWPWSKRAPLPAIPPSPYRPIEIQTAEPKGSGIEVREVDASTVDDADLEALRLAQSQTGMHRVWRRLTGQDPSA